MRIGCGTKMVVPFDCSCALIVDKSSPIPNKSTFRSTSEISTSTGKSDLILRETHLPNVIRAHLMLPKAAKNAKEEKKSE